MHEETSSTGTGAREAFVEWLKERGYEPALWVCPMEEGEFRYAEQSCDLVPDFKVDRPEYADVGDSEIVPDDGLWDVVSDYLVDLRGPGLDGYQEP
jgi:hypothetical protein